MRKLSFVLALLAIAKIGQAYEDEEDVDDEADGSVIALTQSTFDEHIKKNKYVLAEFYAPWCGHCKALAPHYEKAAEHFKHTDLPEGKKVSLAKIDATEEKELGDRFQVRGYPSLMWFVDGKQSEYDGGRTSETIIEWIVDAVSPAVKEAEAAPEPSKRPVVVLAGPTKTSEFEALADTNRKAASFVFVKSNEGSSKVTIQHSGEPVIEAPEGEDLSAWFAKNSYPFFGTLDGETYGKYMSRGIGMVWILLDAAGDMSANQSRSMGMEVGRSLAGKYSVFSIDTVEFKGPIESILGVTSFPAIAVHKTAGDKKKFIYRGDLTAEKIINFVNDVESGIVEAELKSEPEPNNNDGPVRVIVGKTLEKEVFTNEKDVLLEVYAPWCGHCKKLEPEFEKVGKKVKKEGLANLLTIAKMDGTANDSPIDSINWTGFPTLFYIKAGSETPIPYDGGRDAKSIWKWIKSNHSNKEAFVKNKEVRDEL